ncbi:nitroreductase [Rhodococcus sp. T2V]|uniref:nitroreductase n=1 Tax=Rhodococcus sp. T2V TaxID=3034164 RepID=UPI0023E25F4F|nr:nitroreductase [Rhodococcus sp. T2V]MDF3305263.1 nitroreductase [Rhodococcus sp. T2V]
MTTLETTDTNVLARLLEDRWSCRGFSEEPVPRPVIEQVLDLARLSPSWCNTQPWHLVVTDGAGTERFRKALSEQASGADLTPDFPFPDRYSGVYQDRRRECGMQLYESVGVVKGDRAASATQAARNFEFFGAPHTAVVTTSADLGVYGAVDCGLYVQTFLLAAQSLGLGAIPQAAFAAHSPFIRDFFDLPEDRLVVCGISFGYPDRDHAANGFRTRRAAVGDTFAWVDR